MIEVREFTGGQLDQAHEAALDPGIDLVVVRGLLNVCSGSGSEWVKDAEERFRDYTPDIEKYWQENGSRFGRKNLAFSVSGIAETSTAPHIDLNYVGYAVSLNSSDESRQFYARRAPIYPKAKWREVPLRSRQNYNAALRGYPVDESEWATLNSGDAALFGQHPLPAIHASRGATFNTRIIGWRDDGIKVPTIEEEY